MLRITLLPLPYKLKISLTVQYEWTDMQILSKSAIKIKSIINSTHLYTRFMAQIEERQVWTESINNLSASEMLVV
jgi:hypothetical protein